VEQEKQKLEKARQRLELDKQVVLLLAKEKSKGFPWLAEKYAEYFERRQLKLADWLATKSHPALKSAEKVREVARARRSIERKLRISQEIIKYWRYIFPFLDDFRGNVDEEILRQVMAHNVSEPIKFLEQLEIDPVRLWLPAAEYEKLSEGERNQRALDIYWSRAKSPWEVGRIYERYIGYLHEKDGYQVYYQGILEGLEDLGRDLVAKGRGKTFVIQCKHWAAYKRIHERHVNQLFGTTTMYKIDHPNETVVPVLWTSTQLSERAREFAKHLRIALKEEFPFQQYPCIKCNISRQTGEKIYHLPFDQQYDSTLVEYERGELYVATVKEAEDLGFRRAWRWHGQEVET
jgi:hypothetical protein